MRRKALSENSRGRWKIGCILAALVAAVAVFIVMLQLEKSALEDYEKTGVYIAKEAVPRGRIITSDNFEDYFSLQEMDVSLLPETAIQTVEEVLEWVPRYDIEKGTIVTLGMFTDMNLAIKNMRNPVVAGLKADDLYQVVGGLIRAGDRIHVYRVDEEDEAKPVWENLYVQGVFDQSGVLITGSDSNSSANRINVYMDKEDVAFFYSELAKGTLRVVKVCESK